MRFASACAVTLLAALPATAQNDTSWVSRSGSDANTCTLASPCRTFQGAYSKTNANGTIKALDAGEYGLISVTKSITIDGNGVGAAIEVTGGSSIFGVTVSGGAHAGILDLGIHVPPSCTSCGAISSLNSTTNIQ